MALTNYYQLLELPPSASADEIKRAFRQQIAVGIANGLTDFVSAR